MPERYGELAPKLLGLAEAFGCADLVETDVNGELFLNEKLTEGPAKEKINQFVEDAFWSELAARLAERDLRAERGRDAMKIGNEFSEEDREKLDQLEDAYWREFEASGVDHLVVLRGGQG
jgi:hypothetical protein